MHLEFADKFLDWCGLGGVRARGGDCHEIVLVGDYGALPTGGVGDEAAPVAFVAGAVEWGVDACVAHSVRHVAFGGGHRVAHTAHNAHRNPLRAPLIHSKVAVGSQRTLEAGRHLEGGDTAAHADLFQPGGDGVARNHGIERRGHRPRYGEQAEDQQCDSNIAEE